MKTNDFPRSGDFFPAGMLTRPARDVEPERIIEAVQQGTRKVPIPFAESSVFKMETKKFSEYLCLAFLQQFQKDWVHRVFSPFPQLL